MGFAGLGIWIERRAARSPSSVALVTADATRSYADLAREVRAVTGDIGTIDSDGYLTFIDRASSVMRVGDAAVYTATIERALYGTPGISDVAAVDVDGRIVVGVVADAATDPDDVLPLVSASVAPHDIPHEVRVVAEIPRNAAGKVRRDILRQLLMDR